MIKLQHIILENTLDTYTKDISKTIIDQLKGGGKNFERYYEIVRGVEEAAFDVLVKYHKAPKLEYSHSISGGGDMDTLEIDIQYNPKMFPGAMNSLIAEVRETIRHELEHVGQQSFEDMFIVAGDKTDYNTYQGYLTKPVEVPAYVKGFITRASYLKKTLDQVMEDWHKDNIANFEFHKDASWPEIKTVWMNWAVDNKDKIKKYK
jgi:hypothetical protein